MKRCGCLAVVGLLLLPLVFCGLLMIGAAGGTVATSCTVGGAATDLPDSVGPWSGESIEVAAAIIDKGSQLGVPERGIIIALMTAMQESGLRNLPDGDRDSVDPFQQRPSAGWGTVEELMTLSYSTAAFYGGPSGPNHGSPRGLLDVEGWESMGLGEAAQAVQVSAYPGAYSKWEASAREVLAAVGTGTLCGGGSADVVAQAEKWLGTPYAWGGGGIFGPSPGFGSGAGVIGFDCSGLSSYAIYHGAGVAIARTAEGQQTGPKGTLLFEDLPPGTASMDEALRVLRPGDLVFMSRCPGLCPAFHVVVYAGGGEVVHAPKPGDVVSRGQLSNWSGSWLAAKRYP